MQVDRQVLKFLIDVGAAGAAFLVALMLRSGLDFVKLSPAAIVQALALFLGICALVFWARGLHRGVWRYTSLPELRNLIVAVTIAVVAYSVVQGLWTGFAGLPRSSVPITWGTAILLLGGLRLAYRMARDRYLLERADPSRAPVLLIGAGDGAELFVRATQRDPASPYRVVGIVGTDADRVAGKIHGVDVLGGLHEVDAVLDRLRRRGLRPQRLVVTSADLVGRPLDDLIRSAASQGMSWSRLPRLTDLADGDAGRLEVKPIAIEDLLGRPQTALDRAAMASLVGGRRVLVTGAGGSIGGELSRQIAGFGPARLTLVDSSEYNLYAVDLDVEDGHPDLPRRAVLGDVRDAVRMEQLFAQERPELVFHAAALKHVPLVEDNPVEAIAINVLGTRVVAGACSRHGAAAMVQISTDKAVDPVNVMGASKRLAETICQSRDLDSMRSGGTRFVTVRFGNVLGSSGSVVPLFQRQIAAGGPVTVTDPAVTRYFMTVREAVELVLQASALGYRDAEAAGKIFVLDMGEPVRIVDLARQMIRLAGLRPGDDIKITYTGLRRGEKLTESLLHQGEALLKTGHAGLLLAAPRVVDAAVLDAALDELAAAAETRDRARCLDLLHRLVPEFRSLTEPAAEPRGAVAAASD